MIVQRPPSGNHDNLYYLSSATSVMHSNCSWHGTMKNTYMQYARPTSPIYKVCV